MIRGLPTQSCNDLCKVGGFHSPSVSGDVGWIPWKIRTGR